MQTVQISPEVKAEEAAALEAFLRHRGLLQGQAIADLVAEIAAKDAEIAAVKGEAARRLRELEDQLRDLMESSYGPPEPPEQPGEPA